MSDEANKESTVKPAENGKGPIAYDFESRVEGKLPLGDEVTSDGTASVTPDGKWLASTAVEPLERRLKTTEQKVNILLLGYLIVGGAVIWMLKEGV